MVEQFAALLDGPSEVPEPAPVAIACHSPVGLRPPARARQTGSPADDGAAPLRHSGRGRSGGSWSAAAVAVALAAAALPAQRGPQLELDLRSGRKVLAEQLIGSPADGYRVRAGGRTEQVAHKDLVAIRIGPANAPELLQVELVGGDRLYGAIAGGDANGDGLELLSPVLGKVAVPIDRLVSVVQPGVHPGDQEVPDGVDEALFVPTSRGFDLIAGTLFRFGPQGVQFQTEGREPAQWYTPRQFSSLRIRGGLARPQRADCTLLTRSADRLGVTLQRCTEDGVVVELETGRPVTLRWLDLACLVFAGDVVHLSDLEPKEVVERGFAGEPVLTWQRDRSVTGAELLVQRRAWGRGLGVHSMCRLTYVVPDGATHLRTAVAFDDSVAELPLRAHAVARLLRNDRVVFEVEDLAPGQPPRDAGLQVVEPGDTITLEVDFGEGRDLGDRVDWLLPLFLLRSGS